MYLLCFHRNTFEPRHGKTGLLHMRKQRCNQHLCFCYTDSTITLLPISEVQSLYFLYPKSQTSSYLLQLYSLVCVEPSRKPRRPFFHVTAYLNLLTKASFAVPLAFRSFRVQCQILIRYFCTFSVYCFILF